MPGNPIPPYPVPVPDGLDALGIPSAATFLRGDRHWATPAGATKELVLNLTALTDGFEFDPYYSPYATVLTLAVANLGTTGSSDTVVDVNVNGSSVSTITLGSGVAVLASSTLSTTIRALIDYTTVTCTTSGTGASGLVVVLVYSTATP